MIDLALELLDHPASRRLRQACAAALFALLLLNPAAGGRMIAWLGQEMAQQRITQIQPVLDDITRYIHPTPASHPGPGGTP